MKGKIAVAFVLIAIIATNIFFWNFIYSKDVQANYNSGLEQGKTTGYQNGHKDGYNAGIVEGNQTGYQNGLNDGKTIGYTQGYNEGNSSGYANGFHQGMIDGVGTKFNIRDPTYQEMLNFIALDKTDEHPFDEDTYNCYDYTNAVCSNAFNAGYHCGDVYVDFPDCAHALVCFNTTDRGLIFIEPQSDDIMTLIVGQHYWNRAIYKAPDYDDTIVRYGVIW